MAYRCAILLLGVILAAYWGRVLRMALRARRRTGRAANLLPREPLGRILRGIWAPAVAVWVAHPFVTALADPHTLLLRPIYSSAWIAWPAAALAAGGLALSAACWKAMGRNWRMGIDPAERTRLVVTGPYAYVRHPIYALSHLMMLASVAAIPAPLMFLAGGVHLILLQWEARREEHYLRRAHGESYADYCATVGRFFPTLGVGVRR